MYAYMTGLSREDGESGCASKLRSHSLWSRAIPDTNGYQLCRGGTDVGPGLLWVFIAGLLMRRAPEKGEISSMCESPVALARVAYEGQREAGLPHMTHGSGPQSPCPPMGCFSVNGSVPQGKLSRGSFKRLQTCPWP